jgi:MFS family permease
MVLLFLAANLYSIDKGIVGVLAEPIRREFSIGDSEMGLLLGLAYSLLSGVLGLGLGWLVDHRKRRNLLAGAITLWSVSTIACGLSQGFSHFFIARMLVGLGEAAVAPAALSLIADLFEPRHRGRALSAYLIGASVGSALSSTIPGWIVGSGLALDLPLFGTVAPWRSAFVLCGAVGPLIGLLFLTVREPVRHGLSDSGADLARIGAKLGHLWSMRRVVVPLYAGFCLFYVALVGITAWTATFLGRRYGLTIADFSGALGLMLLISGMGGYLVSGFLSDSRLGRGSRGRIALLAGLPLLALPSAFATFAPGVTSALLMLAAIGTAMPILNVAMNATVQDILPNRMRGFGYAVLGLSSALIAGAGGPWLVAMATDHLLGDPARIGTSFVIVGLPALLASFACFTLAGRAIRPALGAGLVSSRI